MKTISVTEFRNNLAHYINLSQKHDIAITKNGEVVAVLSKPDNNYYQALIKLCGCLKDVDNKESYEDIIGDEILRKCGA